MALAYPSADSSTLFRREGDHFFVGCDVLEDKIAIRRRRPTATVTAAHGWSGASPGVRFTGNVRARTEANAHHRISKPPDSAALPPLRGNSDGACILQHNNYIVLRVVLATGPTGLLAPGIHAATWEELVALTGTSPYRVALLAGLRAAALELQRCGCPRLYVDGSFVTDKPLPGDYDGCWELKGTNLAMLDPVLKDLSNKRAAQKAKYGGELFPASAGATAAGRTFLDFFQIDKTTGAPKGIIAIDLTRPIP